MKVSRIVGCCLLMIIGFSIFFSCKKSQEKSMLGPEVRSDIALLEPLSINRSEVDFTNKNANKVTFTAKFNMPVYWRITINGTRSFAERNIEGYSEVIDSTIASWNGSQDSLYYFDDNELCTVKLSLINDVPINAISSQLVSRGDLKGPLPTIESFSAIKILRRKQPENYASFFELLPQYVPSVSGSAAFTVGYDDENHNNQVEYIDPVKPLGTGFTTIFNFPLEYAKGQRAIRGDKFFMVKGLDQDEPPKGNALPKQANIKNYYIGRLATMHLVPSLNFRRVYTPNNNTQLATLMTNILDKSKNVSPDSLYLNVFVYGVGDGSKINVSFKEDEGGQSTGKNQDGAFTDTYDEFYQKTIKLDFKGWKLFSFRYNDAEYTKHPGKDLGDALFEGKYANKKKEPYKLVMVQFGLVSAKLGGTAQFIIDYPTLTLGGPLKY